jgi:hypothetical protein
MRRNGSIMADKERLELTLRNTANGREWTGDRVEVMEDPDDYPAILKHLPALARALDGHRGEDLSRYSLRVIGIDRRWRDFVLPGSGA